MVMEGNILGCGAQSIHHLQHVSPPFSHLARQALDRHLDGMPLPAPIPRGKKTATNLGQSFYFNRMHRGKTATNLGQTFYFNRMRK